MAAVNPSGQLVRFTVAPGNAAEVRYLLPLINGLAVHEVIADKAYDSTAIRDHLASQSIIATIPPRVNRRVKPVYDLAQYKTRHIVENYFAHLKHWRGIATRYCKLAETFRAFVCLGAWCLETRYV